MVTASSKQGEGGQLCTTVHTNKINRIAHSTAARFSISISIDT